MSTFMSNKTIHDCIEINNKKERDILLSFCLKDMYDSTN